MTLQWDELPSWQRDNQHILSGYRPSSNTFSKSFASLTYLHNESVNIYSHLIPAVILSFLNISFYSSISPRYESFSIADSLAFGCFFLGAVLCLGISATFHTIQNHSSHIARIANQVDYIGIVFLIVGSFIPSLFYAFYCHPNLQIIYLTMISFLGLLCAAISASAQFRRPTWRPFRARMLISLGLLLHQPYSEV
ncbi:hemolysin-III related-domain-containing protein [Penicillium waksmanii]|uniref:hemolysin-III related-domain-containing protein n=1 Tax=Penicillium waksmanii TaxID=69791 RepID=UPI002546650D|nr:hemolysin-III related-domain-containing protein [Penicillium waksmanii]KAJ5976574.1 hemolysin-III related-domain-containing protein [Penicillium waksmanii]